MLFFTKIDHSFLPFISVVFCLTFLGSHVFSDTMEEQCISWLRRCNHLFHGPIEGPDDSGLEAMLREFDKTNLFRHMQMALQGTENLDIYQYQLIGICYCKQQHHNDTSEKDMHYSFFCVYSSIASLILHCTAWWKAHLVGWVNYNMDVVHELSWVNHLSKAPMSWVVHVRSTG